MEMAEILPFLTTASGSLNPAIIQDLMRFVKKGPEHISIEYFNGALDILWNHLNIGLNNFDDQLLCSTCFYSILVHIETKDYYLTQIQKTLEKELEIRKREKTLCHSTLVSVSLMYGMMQSSFLTNTVMYDNENVICLFKVTLNLLFYLAYEYTQYTFVVFKIIKSCQKVCGTSFQTIMFNENNQKQLLNLINHNWENPITGIRDICKDIFGLLLSVMDKKLIKRVVEQVKQFYWNKAKFFMLAGIVKQFVKDGQDNLAKELNLNEGLINSLHKPGLVSAGADMYFEILKKIKSADEWCDMFLQDVINVFIGNSKKAIENFNNYWYLATLKMFPNVSNRLIKEIDTNTGISDDWRLYNVLFLMKQRNKVGIFESDLKMNSSWKIEKHILNGLEHWDTTTRILAFEILCISNKKLSNVECDLVLDYLNNNVNSDCTVLRQNMLRGLTCFLTTLHQYYLKKSGESEKNMITNFILNLQELIIKSLNYNGNYQRKITTVKILNIVITTLSGIPKGKHCKNKDTLVKDMKASEQWLLTKDYFISNLLKLLKDPADDIRYNVGHILLIHYSDQLMQPDTLKRLYEDAIICIKSKFFFEINCGLNIFKMISNLLLSSSTLNGSIESIENLFGFGVSELKKAFKQKNKIVDAIFKGEQLHPYVSLILVVMAVCHNKSYKIKVPYEDIHNIMKILEDISKQFACENAATTSTDFAQMNDLVENLISKSCHNAHEEMYDSQISGLHKLVLNSLWLNVKATCELASFLIIYYKEDLFICQKCLKVISVVLETSRHKGAIEAAGASLGQAINHLTSISTNTEISLLPRELLECKLRAWITEASTMASVTRRGAGMSIMVHRIVANDMRREKPLFHYFIKKLLDVCMNSDSNNIKTGKSEKDLPKSIYIHFLTKIVTDSSLAAHTLFYSTELAEIAFDNLTDEHWQIRNAALQLYGALVPKLIGQKKASGSDEESVATVAISEFRTHFPKLWKYIRSQLIHHKENSLEADSNLVPILNLIASLAKEYDFKFECSDRDENLLVALMKMLGSPIFVVRRLTAQCIFKLYLIDDVYDIVIRHIIVKENQLHGNLLLMKNFHQDIKRKDNYFDTLKDKFTNILKHGKHSFLCKELFESIFDGKELELNDALMEMYRNFHYPGSVSWINSKVQRILRTSWDEIPNLLKIIFLLNDYEIHLEALSHKIAADKSIPKELLMKIANILLSYKKKYNSFGLWKILYQISLRVNIGNQINFDEIMQSVKVIYHKNRYLLPLKARNAKFVNSYSIAMCIHMISFKQTEEDLRYMAATANNELASYIDDFDEKTKLTIVENAIRFLQDEDEDIRTLSVDFLKNVDKVNLALNPFICLQKILNKDFFEKYFTNAEPTISELKKRFAPEPINYISDDDDDFDILNIDDNNPFANVSENIYEEPYVIRELIQNMIK